MAMLETDQLIERAQRATNLDDFGGDSFREGLDILLGDINRDAGRPPEFVERIGGMFTKALADRLGVLNALRQRPELRKAPVAKPVFVLGLPRTGTTLTSNLLAADPDRRSALKWELDSPVPPPTSATLRSDPRAIAAVELDSKTLEAYPDAGKYNPWRPLYPHECTEILAHDFKTLKWESAGKLPAYREWIFQANMRSAYEYHKQWLQLHQADAPGIWNLKMPSHALNIETLLDVYSDGRVIWIHRDPFTATASLCSLINTGHMAFAGYVDRDWIGWNYPWQAAQHAERAMDARARLGHDRIIDVYYADVVRDPISAMRLLYRQLGDEFTPQAEMGMRAWLAENPQGKFGRHEYELDQFGLSKEELSPLFDRYLSAYDIEMEA